MSVLLVGDADAADDIQIQSSITQYDYLYRQLNELEHPFSVSPSIVRPNSCRPRHRPQQCAGQHLLTYMLALLVLTNHLHWSLIVLSVSSSIRTVSTSTTTTTPGPRQPPSTAAIPPTDQQCLLINSSHIDRICSRTCRAPTTPFDRWLTVDQILLDMHILPFCSNHLLNHSVNYTNFLNETSESQCREILTQLIAADDEARTASDLFATYMQAIDCASPENRYSIVEADCQVRSIACRALDTVTCRRRSSSEPIRRGRVPSKFHSSIEIISYHPVKQSVMKLSVFVPPFDPVIVNRYLLDSRCSSAVVSRHTRRTHSRRRLF